MKNEQFDPNHDQGFDLRRAVIAGDVAKIKTLLEAGAQVDVLQNAPVRWAVRHRQASVASLLLESGASIDTHEAELILLAASNGDAATLGLLLSKLSKPYDRDLLDQALIESIKSHNSIVVNMLLDCGADPTADNHEVLMTAASGGDAEIVRLVTLYGADVCARDSQALFHSVFSQHPRVIEFLLATGADIHAQRGIPLQLAVSLGDSEIVEILLRAGVPMTDPAWVADVAQTDSIETLCILAAHGADWHGYADQMAFDAAKNGRARMLAYILAEASALNKVNLSKALAPAA
ncbi:MAG: ankyrin repeat domain-containing protein [Limisphaerales bacterium]